ncbi:FkbM family methyltransferase [Flavobacterium soyangense]|uniref:FkbM family methyltransferase n=1 Tax=Flavobacterium soyangense TaxID=2023265 RepID=A0A930U7K7_9FLAO|nr:FkbM family methyltransferase [Flavobacterium soyangense]MBF2708231.1 FkbM family methyltransferase [Flavobacterium soyangense]
MKKYIYQLFRKFGYRISNESKRKKELMDLVKSYGIDKDYNNLTFRAISYYNKIKDHYPTIIIKSHKQGVIIEIENLKLYLESPEEFYIVKEVFVEKDYNFLADNKFVVFDIGMNIGISSLFFSLNKNIDKIYSFEPVLTTYNQALYNLGLNTKNSNKIETFNFGLGGSTRMEKVLYNSQAKGNCGIRLGLSPSIDIDNSKEIEIEIKAVEEILPELLGQHLNQKIVFKIDCEGAEYEIIEKLSSENLLNIIDMLLIEWHDKGPKMIEEVLINYNFIIISRVFSPISGMIYAFKKE